MRIDLKVYVEDLSTKFKPDMSIYTKSHYLDSLRACDISSIDSDALNATWRELRTKLQAGVSYGYVEGTIKVIKGALRRHGILNWLRDYDYNLLISETRKRHNLVAPFTDEEVRRMFLATISDKALQNALILATYAGLRIGAIEGLKFSQFEKVQDVPVYILPVRSKGKEYDAVISQFAYDNLYMNAMFANNGVKTDQVIPLQKQNKTAFANIARMRLKRCLAMRNDCVGIMKDKSPFHSLRHFFCQKVVQTNGLDAIELALLMGHNMPATIALKMYTERKDLHKRMANAYLKTPLATTNYLPTLDDLQVSLTQVAVGVSS